MGGKFTASFSSRNSKDAAPSVDRGTVGNANAGSKVGWNNGNPYTDNHSTVDKHNPSAGGGGWGGFPGGGWSH